jgi:hypothetical protein
MINFFFNILKKIGFNFIFNLHKLLFSFVVILIFVFGFFRYLLIDYKLDEERIYFFVVLLVFVFSWKIFEELGIFFINSRTEVVINQYQNAYTKLESNLEQLKIFQQENFSYFIQVKEVINKVIQKMDYLFFFWLKFLFFAFLISNFYKFFFIKINEFFQDYNIFINKNIIFERSIKGVENFINFYSSFLILIAIV